MEKLATSTLSRCSQFSCSVRSAIGFSPRPGVLALAEVQDRVAMGGETYLAALDDGSLSPGIVGGGKNAEPACGKARFVCCPGREGSVMSLWLEPTRFSLRDGSGCGSQAKYCDVCFFLPTSNAKQLWGLSGMSAKGSPESSGI